MKQAQIMYEENDGQVMIGIQGSTKDIFFGVHEIVKSVTKQVGITPAELLGAFATIEANIEENEKDDD